MSSNRRPLARDETGTFQLCWRVTGQMRFIKPLANAAAHLISQSSVEALMLNEKPNRDKGTPMSNRSANLPDRCGQRAVWKALIESSSGTTSFFIMHFDMELDGPPPNPKSGRPRSP
jgi:hypothetical protein